MTDIVHADVIVIGAGIAGAGVAAELAGNHKVVVLEREKFPGYHSTGRSAAAFLEIYGGPAVRALTRASHDFLFSPPGSFAPAPMTRVRGFVVVANDEQAPALDDFAARPDVAPAVRKLAPAEALARCPILKPDVVKAALIEEGAHDIDVDLLHQGYLRAIKANGGRVLVDQDVKAITRVGGDWEVQGGATRYRAPIVINAAGAWADEIAALAGVRKLGFEPKRRTAVLVDPPAGAEIGAWPLVMDMDEQFYFKPDAGRLLLSPADETPTAPCDAYTEDMDIAIAVDRVQQFANLEVNRVVRSWAGLRTFAPDRTPVAGYDLGAAGFFWLAGQGGYGIQTAPALSRAAAALVAHRVLPEDLLQHGVRADALSPARFDVRETSRVAQVAETR